MYSFTIAAVVLVTGVASMGSTAAEFVYVKNTLKFETMEECKFMRAKAYYNDMLGKAANTVGHPAISECEEVR